MINKIVFDTPSSLADEIDKILENCTLNNAEKIGVLSGKAIELVTTMCIIKKLH